jgi:hypothetical protein
MSEILGSGTEIQHALEEKALELLRVLSIEWIGFLEFCSGALSLCSTTQAIGGESFQCRDDSAPNLFLAVCLCIWVGVRYRVIFSGQCTGLGIGVGIAIAIVITGVTRFRGLSVRFFKNLADASLGCADDSTSWRGWNW